MFINVLVSHQTHILSQFFNYIVTIHQRIVRCNCVTVTFTIIVTQTAYNYYYYSSIFLAIVSLLHFSFRFVYIQIYNNIYTFAICDAPVFNDPSVISNAFTMLQQSVLIENDICLRYKIAHMLLLSFQSNSFSNFHLDTN